MSPIDDSMRSSILEGDMSIFYLPVAHFYLGEQIIDGNKFAVFSFCFFVTSLKAQYDLVYRRVRITAGAVAAFILSLVLSSPSTCLDFNGVNRLQITRRVIIIL